MHVGHKRLPIAFSKFRAGRGTNSGASRRATKERTTHECGETKVGEDGAMRRAHPANPSGRARIGEVSRQLRRCGAHRRRSIAVQPCRSQGARAIVHVQLGARERSEPDAGRFGLVSTATGRGELSSLRGQRFHTCDVGTDRALPRQTPLAIARAQSPPLTRAARKSTFLCRYSGKRNRSKILKYNGDRIFFPKELDFIEKRRQCRRCRALAPAH
jgi:hypothetical protein